MIRSLPWKVKPMKAPRARRFLVGVILICGLLGACSAPRSSEPMPQPIPRVGLMHVGIDHNPPSLATLVAGLGELGWFDGSTNDVMEQLIGDETFVQGRMKQLQGEYDGHRIQLLWHNLEGKEDADGQAADYVARRVSVIVAFEDKSIAAAQAATADAANRIPVVFLHPSDPVRQGLVESLSHPGGNLTGVFGARDPVAKQLEYYKDIIPNLKRLLTLIDPTDAATPALLQESRDAAAVLGLELDTRDASDEAGLKSAFHSLGPGEVDGAFILSPSLRLNFSKVTIDLATQAGLPVQAHRKEWVEQGALFSLGVDVGPVGTAGARYVDAILRGTAPAELPVEEVPKNQFAISLKRARELGITVPPEVIDRADKVYQ
jgi:ABC-type uncharacterized transport system substrate-binding protein